MLLPAVEPAVVRLGEFWAGAVVVLLLDGAASGVAVFKGERGDMVPCKLLVTLLRRCEIFWVLPAMALTTCSGGSSPIALALFVAADGELGGVVCTFCALVPGVRTCGGAEALETGALLAGMVAGGASCCGLCGDVPGRSQHSLRQAVLGASTRLNTRAAHAWPELQGLAQPAELEAASAGRHCQAQQTQSTGKAWATTRS